MALPKGVKRIKRAFVFEPKVEYSNLSEYSDLAKVLEKLNSYYCSMTTNENNKFCIRTFQIDAKKATAAEFYWWLRRICGFPRRTKAAREFAEKYFRQYEVNKYSLVELRNYEIPSDKVGKFFSV